MKLNIPVDRARLEKENVQLEKQIANLDLQFADQESLAKKPEKIVAGMREKKGRIRGPACQKPRRALRFPAELSIGSKASAPP